MGVDIGGEVAAGSGVEVGGGECACEVGSGMEVG